MARVAWATEDNEEDAKASKRESHRVSKETLNASPQENWKISEKHETNIFLS